MKKKPCEHPTRGLVFYSNMYGAVGAECQNCGKVFLQRHIERALHLTYGKPRNKKGSK
jgi:hypothetical protein